MKDKVKMGSPSNDEIAERLLSYASWENTSPINRCILKTELVEVLDTKDELMRDAIDEAYPVGVINSLGKTIGHLMRKLERRNKRGH